MPAPGSALPVDTSTIEDPYCCPSWLPSVLARDNRSKLYHLAFRSGPIRAERWNRATLRTWRGCWTLLPLAICALVVFVAEPLHASTVDWDLLAQCSSRSVWDLDLGNGVYGGLAIIQTTWTQFGGLDFAPRADLAPKDEQIAVAEKILAGQDWRVAWPHCGAETGLAAAHPVVAGIITDAPGAGQTVPTTVAPTLPSTSIPSTSTSLTTSTTPPSTAPASSSPPTTSPHRQTNSASHTSGIKGSVIMGIALALIAFVGAGIGLIAGQRRRARRRSERNESLYRALQESLADDSGAYDGEVYEGPAHDEAIVVTTEDVPEPTHDEEPSVVAAPPAPSAVEAPRVARRQIPSTTAAVNATVTIQFSREWESARRTARDHQQRVLERRIDALEAAGDSQSRRWATNLRRRLGSLTSS